MISDFPAGRPPKDKAMLWQPDPFPTFGGSMWSQQDGPIYQPIDFTKPAVAFTTSADAFKDVTPETILKAAEELREKFEKNLADKVFAAGATPSLLTSCYEPEPPAKDYKPFFFTASDYPVTKPFMLPPDPIGPCGESAEDRDELLRCLKEELRKVREGYDYREFPERMPWLRIHPHPRDISPERAREITGGAVC